MREASILVVGHVFQEKEMPSSSSCIVGSNGSAGGGGASEADGVDWGLGAAGGV